MIFIRIVNQINKGKFNKQVDKGNKEIKVSNKDRGNKDDNTRWC